MGLYSVLFSWGLVELFSFRFYRIVREVIRVLCGFTVSSGVSYKCMQGLVSDDSIVQ